MLNMRQTKLLKLNIETINDSQIGRWVNCASVDVMTKYRIPFVKVQMITKIQKQHKITLSAFIWLLWSFEQMACLCYANFWMSLSLVLTYFCTNLIQPSRYIMPTIMILISCSEESVAVENMIILRQGNKHNRVIYNDYSATTFVQHPSEQNDEK